jgi:hypothetical protein
MARDRRPKDRNAILAMEAVALTAEAHKSGGGIT